MRPQPSARVASHRRPAGMLDVNPSIHLVTAMRGVMAGTAIAGAASLLNDLKAKDDLCQ